MHALYKPEWLVALHELGKLECAEGRYADAAPSFQGARSLGHSSAISRPSLAISRPSLGYLSAISRLSLGYRSLHLGHTSLHLGRPSKARSASRRRSGGRSCGCSARGVRGTCGWTSRRRACTRASCGGTRSAGRRCSTARDSGSSGLRGGSLSLTSSWSWRWGRRRRTCSTTSASAASSWASRGRRWRTSRRRWRPTSSTPTRRSTGGTATGLRAGWRRRGQTTLARPASTRGWSPPSTTAAPCRWWRGGTRTRWLTSRRRCGSTLTPRWRCRTASSRRRRASGPASPSTSGSA